jgi:glutathione S-transferase
MKLYHHPFSSSSRRASLTAAHLGITLDHRIIDLAKDRSELVAVNPNSKIPVLVDGDFTLWESHAIMQYFCELTPGQTLYPTALRPRTDVQRWLYWTSAHLAPAVGPINFERMWKKLVVGPNAEPDAAIVARHEQFFHLAAAVLDKHLAGRTWVVGDAVTLADISIAATLMYWQPTRLPIDAYQNVLALIARVQALPAWKATEPARVA